MAVRINGPDDISRQRVTNGRSVISAPDDPMGRVMENLGERGRDIARTLREQEVESQIVRADLNAKSEIDNILREVSTGPDPTQYETQFTERARRALDTRGQGLAPDVRERWNARTQQLITAGTLQSREAAQTRMVDNARAELRNVSADAERIIRNANSTDEARRGAVDSVRLLSRRSRERGVLSADQEAASTTGIEAVYDDMRRGLAFFEVSRLIETDPNGALARLLGANGEPTATAETMGPQIASAFGAQLTSGRRTAERNAAVGGVENSLHLEGRAIDMSVPAQYRGMTRAAIEQDVRQRLGAQFPGARFSEVIFEGDHIHVGWEAGGAAPEGPFADLSIEQRGQLINTARARQTQISASVRDTLNAQEQLLRRGIIPSDPLDAGAVAATLGVDVAQNYAALYTQAQAQQQMRTLPMERVAQIASGADQPGDLLLTGPALDQTRLMRDAQREAAQATITQRNEDPGEYLLRAGVMRGPNLFDTMGRSAQSGDWAPFQRALRERGADAVEARDRGLVARVAPLAVSEATALRERLLQLPAQDRLTFFSQAATSMNREAYTAMMTQIAPDGGEALAFAGYAYGHQGGRFDGPKVAQRLLRGAELLQGREGGQDRQRRTSVTLPSEAALRGYWDRLVTPQVYEGLPDAREMAYSSFRAYYAARAEEEGGSTTVQDSIAREAMDTATGGAVNWSGRATLLPWGMDRREFDAAIRRGFEQTPALRGRNPRDYDLMAVGGGRYEVVGESHPQSGLPLYVFAVPAARR